MAFKLGRGIDANYHPKKYFYDFDTGLPVKGAMLQAAYRSAVLESDHGAAEAILLNSPTNDQERQLLGSLHPSLMGGLYLPDRAHAEVEVARVTIASTTMDVTCIFASPTAERISFRVVDEYQEQASVAEVIVEITSKRLGATAVVNAKGELKGIITDGDLRRMLQRTLDIQELRADSIMSVHPKSIGIEEYATAAFALMKAHNITQLVVLDGKKIAGFVHIHDLMKEGIV